MVAHILAIHCKEHVSTVLDDALLHEARFMLSEYVLYQLDESNYSMMATTRAGAALARLIFSGKHAMLNPVEGSLSKLTSRSMWE